MAVEYPKFFKPKEVTFTKIYLLKRLFWENNIELKYLFKYMEYDD